MAWWSRQKQLTSVLTNLKQGLPFKYSVELTARRTCPIVFQERHAAYCHNHMIGSIKPMSNFIPGKVPWSDEFPNSVRNQVHFLSRNHDVNHPLMRSQLWNVKTTMFSTQATKESIPETNNHSIKGFAFRKVVPASFSGDNKSQTILMYLAAVAVAMMGLTYAAVPLYSKFCQATGYGGTVQRRETVEEKIARHAKEGTKTTREVSVQFNADVADGMPWRFMPTQREVKVKPGESALAFFTAENLSSKPITGVSTYNVTPMKAAVYFNKVQCFCFEEQKLFPGEKIDMPVFFYIDPEFETDPKMNGINNLILSYTFFKVEDEGA